MQETILIQTDFRVESLILIKSAIQNNPGRKLNIVLVHGVELTDSITELLFFSKHKLLKKVMKEDFETGINEIRQDFAGNINSLRIELFTGYNQSAFNNFLEANKISQIFLANDYAFKSDYKNSKDLALFISRSVQKKVEIAWARSEDSYPQLAMLH
ncbi:MAG: hypothetical protein WC716_10750 [Chitinophagaceae bacterium]|jgi:hypothetical protein